MASASTAQKAVLNNFENVINTLSYASSKVKYSVGENIYMLLSDMNLNIWSGTVGYNNKILVSDGNFSLRKNDTVNTLELAKISHKAIQQPLLIKTRN